MHEVQGVVGRRECREPVFAIDLLAPCGELREQVFLHALFLLYANVGHGLARVFHDLEIVVVHPNATLKVTLAFFHLLRSDVEGVAVQLVEPLLSGVGHGIEG